MLQFLKVFIPMIAGLVPLYVGLSVLERSARMFAVAAGDVVLAPALCHSGLTALFR
jgi:hypothetical protein